MTFGILARAEEIVEIDQVQRIVESGEGPAVFTPAEWSFAFTKADPTRRLAARYAAKRATLRLLGGTPLPLALIEIVRPVGRPPQLALHGEARQALDGIGGGRLVVSLTHSRRHAAALVLLLQPGAA